jgi:hypothetical protein
MALHLRNLHVKDIQQYKFWMVVVPISHCGGKQVLAAIYGGENL